MEGCFPLKTRLAHQRFEKSVPLNGGLEDIGYKQIQFNIIYIIRINRLSHVSVLLGRFKPDSVNFRIQADPIRFNTIQIQLLQQGTPIWDAWKAQKSCLRSQKNTFQPPKPRSLGATGSPIDDCLRVFCRNVYA
ncbi:hypothetical protein ALQ08_103828 [Pseudomonas syringae pv. delphinii]|uniref:Uncharacterized protein n=1 Tax=Pseudomonas syringae pv. delphinii TaxID=192088 RepID=A0A3M4KK50_9PSED|nr:hypothetical protein ALQ28_103635 [Pseudomonas syringae pv. delphinii]RMQ29596.1 hypothetical protein ALQ08_103828 [Pseudomonas syringae pv. delphinii]